MTTNFITTTVLIIIIIIKWDQYRSLRRVDFEVETLQKIFFFSLCTFCYHYWWGGRLIRGGQKWLVISVVDPDIASTLWFICCVFFYNAQCSNHYWYYFHLHNSHPEYWILQFLGLCSLTISPLLFEQYFGQKRLMSISKHSTTNPWLICLSN